MWLENGLLYWCGVYNETANGVSGCMVHAFTVIILLPWSLYCLPSTCHADKTVGCGSGNMATQLMFSSCRSVCMHKDSHVISTFKLPHTPPQTQWKSPIQLTTFGPFMGYSILFRYTLHSKNLDFNVIPPWNRIGNVIHCLLVNLRAMYGQSWGRVKLLVTDVAFEVLRLLVIYQDLVIVKFTVAVPVTLSRKHNNADVQIGVRSLSLERRKHLWLVEAPSKFTVRWFRAMVIFIFARKHKGNCSPK